MKGKCCVNSIKINIQNYCEVKNPNQAVFFFLTYRLFRGRLPIDPSRLFRLSPVKSIGERSRERDRYLSLSGNSGGLGISTIRLSESPLEWRSGDLAAVEERYKNREGDADWTEFRFRSESVDGFRSDDGDRNSRRSGNRFFNSSNSAIISRLSSERSRFNWSKRS